MSERAENLLVVTFTVVLCALAWVGVALSQ